MAWPKGVPRKTQNIDKESAINPFQPQEAVVSQGEPQMDSEAMKGPDAPPHLIENSPGFKPFNDRSSLEDKYAEFSGLTNQEEPKTDQSDSGPGEVPPPAEADTGGEPKTSETIEVQKDEPVTAQPESTPEQQPTATPEPQPVEKYKTKEEAEKAAKEAERKMHEATQERAAILKEKESLEAFNKQMLEVLNAIKTSGIQPQAPVAPKQEEVELTPEQKTELIINNPNEYERLMLDKAKRMILGEIESKQKVDQEEIQKASKQRGLELFIRLGEQHFDQKYQEMKPFEPFVKEETEKILKSPEARELIAQKGPTGLIDQAVINTKARIEQVRTALLAGTTPPPSNANPGEVRTPIPASPVVRPSGIIPAPAPTEPVIPSQEQIVKDYVKDGQAWKNQRGLG